MNEFEGQYNMFCDLEELFPVEKQINSQYIGPLLPECDQDESEFKHWLHKNDKRPTLYISYGSSGDESRLDFLNNRFFRDFNIILTGYLRKIPEYSNVFYKKFVNTREVSDRTYLFISHGGNGSIYQAIEAGIPLIAIPSFFEQNWNAWRIRKTGLGNIHYPEIQPVEHLIFLVKHRMNTDKPPVLKRFQQQVQEYPQSEAIRSAVNALSNYHPAGS